MLSFLFGFIIGGSIGCFMMGINIVKYGWYSILIGGLLVLRQMFAPTGI